MKVIKVILYPFKCLVLLPIYIYKFCISPLLPSCCIYKPSCSTYAVESIKRFGVIKGGYLSIKRIFRCTPSNKGGTDRVEEDIKGDFRWLI